MNKETIFKVGQKVYDQLFFPDIEGVVTSTNFIPEKSFFEKENGYEGFEEGYKHPYPIEVDFKREQALYRNDGSGFIDFPTLSTKPYNVELTGFEQKESAPTFKEVLEKCEKVYPPNIRRDVEYKEIYPSKELSDAAEAIRRLLFLRDYYNEGWLPDYSAKSGWKFCIVNYADKFIKDTTFSVCRVMIFKTEEIRDKFLEDQKELLEIAKPLL